MSAQHVSQDSLSTQQDQRLEALTRITKRLHRGNNVATGVLWTIGGLVTLLFVSIIIKLLIDGAPTLFSASFYSSGETGIASQLFNTFYILLLSEILLFPVALAAAIFLIEYTPQGRLVSIIHFAAETLAGVPSLILGMFGFLVFGILMGMGFSRFSGALTLLCLNLPLALRLFEDALAAVPRDLREGGLALGATKWHVIRTVVLPSALPGLITGIILTAGKIVGEAAALIFTMGLFNPANVFTLDGLIASDTLTTRLYYVKGVGAGTTGLASSEETALAAGISAVLILFLLLINIAARSIGRSIQRRVMAA